MTQCNLEFAYASHRVSKNLTPPRMLKKCFLAAKINQSFRICMTNYRQKLIVLPGKLILSKKSEKHWMGWQRVVTCGYEWLWVVMSGYGWLWVVMCGYECLWVVIGW